MAIFNHIDQLPVFSNAVLTIGTFDGVHLGHKVIIDKVVDHTRRVNGTSLLVTFEPHPRKMLFPDQPLKLLTPLDEKLHLITAAGIDHVVVVPFTNEFAHMSAEEYVRDFLVAKFHPASIVIGYDHHFGHDRTGNLQLLEKMGTTYDFEVIEIPAQLIDDASVSSTKIRKAITAGSIKEANRMLGRKYTLCGKVEEGAKLGRTIGFPTANIQPEDPDQLLPANGVYAIKAEVSDNIWQGMLNIGYRPTVSDERILKIEAHLFDFNDDIYGKNIAIQFVERLRDEQRFASVNDLKTQLQKDKENVLAVFDQIN